MSEAFSPPPTLSLAQEMQVEDACRRFEKAWCDGQRPRIEEYLFAAPSALQPVLLGELLALELTYRQQHGERPHTSEYQQRFPAFDVGAAMRRLDEGQTTQAFGERNPVPPNRISGSAADVEWDAPPGLEIKEKISRGGMGTVYKAYQPSLDRTVAVKTVRPELLTEAGLELFRQEAKLLARFSHPHIVKILEFHPTAAVPYFLMDYVDGRPLDQALRSCTWPQRAEVFAKIAAAVAAAHGHGVVHGDLKPANILVDRDLQPHILDFGLGRLARSDARSDDDDSGGRGGTLGFIAPEVLRGETGSTFLSDIYALGVTLYVVLTGVLPYASRPKVEENDLRLPLEFNADIPEPLQRICLKAMEPRPADRYQTAEHLGHDLGRFCLGEPIFVRPTFYERELTGRVRNHTAAIEMWEKEGIVTPRERDALLQSYQRVVAGESPWLSETRRVLGGPLLIRLGTWLLLVSAILWPAFYWDRLGITARLASSGLPMLLMAALGAFFLHNRQRRNAIACLGSFALLFLVFVVVTLSEFRWLRFLQPEEWELWGSSVTRAETTVAHDFAEELMLCNAQIFAAAVLVAACIALLLYFLKAVFFASWLAAACLGLFTSILLLCGDLYLLTHEDVALVALHYVILAPGLFWFGTWLERNSRAAMAAPFYALGLVVCVAVALAVARFGTEEWFGQSWDWDNEVWNLWLLAYAPPLFAAAWTMERYGTLVQRAWSWLFYLLVPVFVHVPLNMLFDAGPRTAASLGARPVHLYEALYLPASAAFLWFGKKLHLQSFLYAGLAGLAAFLFRTTFLHFDRELAWPLAIAASGGGFVALGIWRSRRRETRR